MTDLRALRQRLGLSQPEFAERYQIPLATVRQWERGRREPHGSAAVLLHLIEREPETIARILAGIRR